MQEVRRFESARLHPVLSSLLEAWWRTGFTLGAFVAGEGCFSRTPKQPPFKDGSPRLRFVFSISVAARDRALLEALHAFLGYGSIRDMPPARAGYQPESEFRITSLLAHHAATIPWQGAVPLHGSAVRQTCSRADVVPEPLLPCHRLLAALRLSPPASWLPKGRSSAAHASSASRWASGGSTAVCASRSGTSSVVAHL